MNEIAHISAQAARTYVSRRRDFAWGSVYRRARPEIVAVYSRSSLKSSGAGSDSSDVICMQRREPSARAGKEGGKLGRIFAILDRIRSLPKNWNHDGAPKVQEEALRFARRFLEESHGEQLNPVRVAPSVVGGVGATFAVDERAAYVEFRNDGRAVMALTNGSEKVDVEQFIGETLREAVLRIQAHLNG